MTVDEAIGVVERLSPAAFNRDFPTTFEQEQALRCLRSAYQSARACLEKQEREIEELRRRLLTAAGDDLCRLSQEDIKQLRLGAVKILPKQEFLASCERFHDQIANESGVMSDCLTLAQLIAENESLRPDADRWRFVRKDLVGSRDYGMDGTMLFVFRSPQRRAETIDQMIDVMIAEAKGKS